MQLVKAFIKLQDHHVLQNLYLNDVSQYARLIVHLMNDILLPQPLDQINCSMPPEVLSLSMAGFLSESLQIEEEYTEDSSWGTHG